MKRTRKKHNAASTTVSHCASSGPSGLACQLLHDFDAPHPTGKLGEDRGLIAQPGSDLEDALMRLGAEEVGHECDYEGLRDRLIEADRQRRVLVSERESQEGGRERCRGTLRIAASTRSSSAASPSSSGQISVAIFGPPETAPRLRPAGLRATAPQRGFDGLRHFGD
jgi:hypothetical protein